MPDRLDFVRVATSGQMIELPWRSRDLLLTEIGRVEACRVAVAAFQAVGASRPVELDAESESLVAQTIDVWTHAVGADGLPAGVWALRNALLDDTHDGSSMPP